MSVKKARQRIENKKKTIRGATQQHNNRVATYMYKTN